MSAAELGRFAGRRLVGMLVVLLVLSFVVFSLLQLAPGDPVRILLGNHPASPQAVAAIEHSYHLDQPFLVQYWEWLKGAVQLDFGNSIQTGQPVGETLSQRLPLSLQLGLLGFLVAMVAGVPLGVWAALRQRRAADRAIVGLSVAGVSAPAFVTGLLLLYLFAVQLEWFPVSGPGGGGLDRLWHLTLPALALALTDMALIVKLTRAGMIRSLEQDYVEFARARGIAERHVLTHYALRNALIPVVTAGGLLLGYTLTGAVLVEFTFGLPGIGSLLVNAVNTKDIPVVQGVAVVLAILIVLVNALTDLLYRLVDPRVELAGAS